MSDPSEQSKGTDEQQVQEALQKNPHILQMLAENSLLVAESVRDNYFKNTAKFVAALRKTKKKSPPILCVQEVGDVKWSEVQNEVVTFIDGGVGRVQMSSQAPILLRVGSYRVKTGERCLTEREQFGYYPVVLGDLEGGSKQREDFVDIVRITAELLGGLAALERTPDLRMLMFHGPLVYTVWKYMGHAPFTESDVDLFLQHYAPQPGLADQVKNDFLNEARLEIYPQIVPNHADEWVRKRLFEPLSWMAFLFRKLIKEAKKRTPVPLIVGVVERGRLREFCETTLLPKVFRHLREIGNEDYFNKIFGRDDLVSPEKLLDALGYNDAILLSMLLKPGDFSEPWDIQKYNGFSHSEVPLPGEANAPRVNFNPLRPGPIGFPKVRGFYISVSDATEPIRVEVFDDLSSNQVVETAYRVYLYARMLPGYGFPVGLDIADKYAKIPAWMTDAYDKMIRFQLGVSLQNGEITDAEMRRLLIQGIYMKQRDWLFRPGSN